MDIQNLVSQMTLEEKASLCSGNGVWYSKEIKRLGIPSVMMTDGPHGLRKQVEGGDHIGLNDSVPATCFPTAAGLACSFDRELLHYLGETLGAECQAEDVAILLGPGVNIKRSPLCGRNFEYFSEDPFLSGELAAAYIRGVQSKNVGVSLKHYAANNQEYRRMSTNAVIDERTLREIYLASFEYAVKGGKPWTVMCAYNKLNGVFGSENPFTLTEVLRDEWGFDGFTVTDWGACSNHVKGVAAGLDLEMPSTSSIHDQQLIDAVRNGEIEEAVVDRAAERILTIFYRYLENRDQTAVYNRKTHHEIARRIARESMVLLKNENQILPLGKEKIAFIGKYAETPRYQGTGSSRINASSVLSALEAVSAVADVVYARGFNDDKDQTAPELLSEAIAVAKESKVAVLFVGLPDLFESEGFDRSHMRLPNCQVELIREVVKVNQNVVVVLHNGSPVEMPWADDVQAILEVYLGGQAVGGATVDILFGAASPCGKLAETFPQKLSDTPCYGFFPGDGDTVTYNESIYIGYRYYDLKEMDVRFPFGHGLSYTTFVYDNLKLDSDSIDPNGSVTVSVDITNTGKVAAKEIVQVYVHSLHQGVSRPEMELKGFEKVFLEPGKTKTVKVTLDSRAFAYWETRIHDWYVEGGMYEIRVGASSRDIRQTVRLEITANQPLPFLVTPESTMGDILVLPGAQQVLAPLIEQFRGVFGGESDVATNAMVDAMMRFMPLYAIETFAGGAFTNEMMWQIIHALNR